MSGGYIDKERRLCSFIWRKKCSKGFSSSVLCVHISSVRTFLSRVFPSFGILGWSLFLSIDVKACLFPDTESVLRICAVFQPRVSRSLEKADTYCGERKSRARIQGMVGKAKDSSCSQSLGDKTVSEFPRTPRFHSLSTSMLESIAWNERSILSLQWSQKTKIISSREEEKTDRQTTNILFISGISSSQPKKTTFKMCESWRLTLQHDVLTRYRPEERRVRLHWKSRTSKKRSVWLEFSEGHLRGNKTSQEQEDYSIWELEDKEGEEPSSPSVCLGAYFLWHLQE